VPTRCIENSHPQPACGEPVSCATGNLYETQPDLAIGGRGVGLDIVRSYNSQAGAAGEHGAFGYGWSASFSAHLTLETHCSGETCTKTITVHQDDASTVQFIGAASPYGGPSWTQDTLTGTSEAGYTLTLPNQTKDHFNGSSGRLESVTDRNGNATTLSYGEAGRLETITDPASRKITLTYNGEGLIEKAKDPVGHVVKYTYEGGNLASVTEPGETEPRWQFKYDGSHQLTEMRDGRGGKTLNEYNEAHQVVAQTDPLKHELTFEYLLFETKITNHATGSVTDERFTSNAEPVSITRGFGTERATTEEFSYNADQNVASVISGNGKKTTYGYNGAHDRTSMVDPDSNETKWTYNETHDVVSMRTPNNETTTIERDGNGNATKISRPAPASTTQITKYKYDAHGNLESTTNPLERTWKYEYDSQGDRTSAADPEGDKRTWSYDADSRESTMVSPRGNVTEGKPEEFTTSTERDAQGRPLVITDPLKHETKFAYDPNGNLESETDPAGHVTAYTYDADNRQTKVKQPNGTVTETGYDGAGLVESQTDGNKQTTKYTRNVLGEVIEVLDPLERKTTKTYDGAGNLKTLTDPAKRTTTYSYDPASQLTKASYSEEATPSVKYEYDADGNRIKMVDGTGTTKYKYDQLDRLTETKDGHGQVSSYEYNLANQQTKITYPNTKSIERAFDDAGRLKSVTDWLEHTIKFAYDADSHQVKTTFPAGSGNIDEYAYDNAGAMGEVKMLKGAETLASLAYTRNEDSEVTKATTVGLPGEEAPGFGYDTNSRLTEGAGKAYKYDAADNPTKIGTPTYSYDAASQLEKGTGFSYSYDAMGERTKTKPTVGPATTYGYDQAGNLISVARPEEGETPAIADSYGYDGSGLRASQTVSGSTSYLGWDVAGELPLILNDGTNSYVYGPGGLPIEQVTAEAVLYLHHDQQGSTRMMTSSTGIASGMITYDGYGNKLGSTGSATSVLGYDGQYTSTDTGLIYMRARDYDPATAQFLSRDPLDEARNTLAQATIGQYVAAATRSSGGSRPYVYANDNPLSNYDPTGLVTVGLCVHAEVNFIVHIGVSGCVQASSSGEVGGTVVGSVGIAQGASVGATVGPQVSNASHISELSGPFANAGGQLGLGPDVSYEAFGAPGECGPVIGGGVSAGVGVGVARWVGGSYTGSWSLSL
jgi:RHS repeat-associated protein